ncbi:P-type conjugative transfer protein TrbG [Robiginitomaculum antarcticum]|uniref:P-type conjugative transfer protein TrbG n=1 Tax=Robiginitomaculum antarcticum TaxID=437507 RepID=UPI00035C87BA|nr:P-type conjugative transfer protein TrbG [Robiginitomaculum antarcticum]
MTYPPALTRSVKTVSALAIVTSLSGCASLQSAFNDLKSSKTTTPSEMSKAIHIPEASGEGEYSIQSAVHTPSIVMPGQMKAKPASIEFFDRPSVTGFQAVSYANQAAIVQPSSENYLNAIQLYPYTPGSVYQVYAAPSQVTDIALERGEALTSVSAGDTQRWTVGDTVSGSGANEQVHILVRPMAAKLSTNAVITTTKRTYYLDLKSFADTYMAAVSWRYPHDVIKQLRGPAPKKARFTKAGFKTSDLKLNPDELRFDYLIKGDSPNWRPTRVFDDGKKVFIQFPKNMAVSEAPPLFVTDKKGKGSKLVNYRVRGEYYVVDRLFDAAELRLGEKNQTVVRIERSS